MISFNHRLKSAIEEKRSFLCVGLDISPEMLGSEDLIDLKTHTRKVIDATRDLAAAYKPNFAFFERWGSGGFGWLEETVDYIGLEHIRIADAKRGDIGSTAAQYAYSIFTHFGFDAVTLNPYMGRDSIAPFLEHPENGVFILCRTSNPSAADFQDEQFAGRPLYEKVAAWANALNEHENVGLVAGATAPEELVRIRGLVPELPLLIPGVGAQGGDLHHSVKAGSQTGVALINISRGISFAGDLSERAIHDAAQNYAEKMNEVFNG